MSAAIPNNGAAILADLREELEKAFRDIPAYGDIGFIVSFVDGYPARIEYKASLTRRVPRREDREARR